MDVLVLTVGGRWRPGIGDPSAYGWATTCAYLAAACACLWAYGRERAAARRGAGGLWPAVYLWLGLAMLLLGVNKQLNLQTAMTQVGRDVARAGGWYRHRRTVQFVFTVAAAAAAVAVVAVARRYVGRDWRRHCLALCGMAFLFGFVLIRMISLHHVDQALFHTKALGRSVTRGLETGSTALVGVAAWRAARSAGRR